MVNRKKPSRGCQRCKTRRVKCDETFPHCQRCKSNEWTCPGVSPHDEWLFHNENNTVALKQRDKEKRRGSLLLSKSSTTVHDFSQSNDLDIMDPPPIAEMKMVLAESPPSTPFISSVALKIFLDHFTQSAKGSKVPDFVAPPTSELPNTLSREPASTSVHLLALCVAFATLSGYRPFVSLKPASAILYGKALRQLSLDLTDDVKSRSDTTLICLNLLIIYETKIRQRGTSTYYEHLKGAAAILRHRGTAQFHNTRSLLLFRSTRANIITGFIRAAEPLDMFENDPFWLSDVGYKDNFSNVMFIMAYKLASFRAQSKCLSLSESWTSDSIAKAIVLLQETRMLDDRLEEWFQNRPEYFEYHSITCASSLPKDIQHSPLWSNTVHIYTCQSTAYIINVYRIIRLYCHEVIAECAEYLQNGRYIVSVDKRKVQELVNDICASIPYHLNYAHTPINEGNMSKSEAENFTRVLSAMHGAYFANFPLMVAAQVEGIPEAQKEWLLARLRFVMSEYHYSVPGTYELCR